MITVYFFYNVTIFIVLFLSFLKTKKDIWTCWELERRYYVFLIVVIFHFNKVKKPDKTHHKIINLCIVSACFFLTIVKEYYLSCET